MAAKPYDEKKELAAGLLRVHTQLNISHIQRVGPYKSKFFRGLKDEGKVWGVKCDQCNRLIIPPMICCTYCHVRLPEYPQNWQALSGKGYLDYWAKILVHMMDATGKINKDPYLLANIWMDEGVQLSGYIDVEPDSPKENQIKRGLRVEMVMKPPEERIGNLVDIKYFKILWDEPIRKLKPSVAPHDVEGGLLD